MSKKYVLKSDYYVLVRTLCAKSLSLLVGFVFNIKRGSRTRILTQKILLQLAFCGIY